ncbi:hypothetical protein M7I_6745 [Glarea lozoyensis 74030]|uniref:Uncharacterized protein n=1 Tax=Glarea lozoyensis (strain ATCC 74030 / MF5533) TaxID=1104152 RepID=H0EVE7_GLAL7|nr:hypothetical protein M7I_6745 [Glarea lozoyensis 74030]
MMDVDSLEVTIGNADVEGEEVTTGALDVGALEAGIFDGTIVCANDSGAWAAGVESGFRDEGRRTGPPTGAGVVSVPGADDAGEGVGAIDEINGTTGAAGGGGVWAGAAIEVGATCASGVGAGAGAGDVEGLLSSLSSPDVGPGVVADSTPSSAEGGSSPGGGGGACLFSLISAGDSDLRDSCLG